MKHRLPARLWHWINAVAVIVLAMSGAMISNAHPHLYWGQFGANFDAAWADVPRFPGWLTIPSDYSLAAARRWHLAFAFPFAFGLAFYLVTGRVRRLFVRRADIAALPADVRDHVRLRFHHDGYSPLQKIVYAGVVFGLLPLLIYTGMMLQPGMNAVLPDLVGGRQSARSLHFLAAGAIVAFLFIHLAALLLAGPWRLMRAMVTGR